MNDIFARNLRGEMVSPNDRGYDELIAEIFATMKVATEMNTGCHTQEEVHEYMGRILGKPLDVSTTVFPPFYIDYVCFTSIVQTGCLGRGGGVDHCRTDDFGTGGAWLAVAEGSVDCAYTGYDEAVTSGRESAYT